MSVAILSLGMLAGCSGPDHPETSQGGTATSRQAATSTVAAITPTSSPEGKPTSSADSAGTPTTSSDTLLTDTPEPTEEANSSPEIDSAEFASLVDALVAEAGGTTAVVVELPDGTLLYDHNGAEQLESASLYKLGIMVEVYHQRDAGVLSFDDGVYMYPGFFSEGEDALGFDSIESTIDVGTLVSLMITASSNVAATALLDLVGTDNINVTMQSLGIYGTEIRWSPNHELSEDCCQEPAPDSEAEEPDTQDIPAEETPEPEGDSLAVLTFASTTRPSVNWLPYADTRADDALNVTTAADLANLYVLLLRGEVVSAQASQEMLDLLAQQEINDRLPVLLPEGTVVAHKTGNLDGLVHDAGVIYAPAGPIVVVVLTEDLDEGAADTLIAQLGLAAYELLDE